MAASEGTWDMDLMDTETMVDSVEVEVLAVDEDSVVVVVVDLVVREDLVAIGDSAGIEDLAEGGVEVGVATPLH